MEDLYLEEMPAPRRDFVLAVPDRRREIAHCVLGSVPARVAPAVRSRLQAVACGFPDLRLRVTARVAISRPGG